MVIYVHGKVAGRKPIIVGVGGNYTKATLDFAKFCAPYSYGLMVTVPHYNKPQQRGIVNHFVTIASDPVLKNKPIIMYNIPGRTCVNMDPQSVIKVIDACPNVVAIKEANSSLDHIQCLVYMIRTITKRTLGDTFKIFAGDDSSILEVSKLGGSGVISVGSNVIPEYIVKLTDMCISNNYSDKEKEIQSMMNELTEFTHALFVETNPVPIKYLLHMLNLYESDSVRAPLDIIRDDTIKNYVRGAFLKMNPVPALSEIEKHSNVASVLKATILLVMSTKN